MNTRSMIKLRVFAMVLLITTSLALPDATYQPANANFLKKVQKSIKKSSSKVSKKLKRTNKKIKRTIKKVAKSPVAPIIGGIVAGVVTNKAFDNKFIGVAVGVAVGAFIANNLKKDLNEEQQTRMTRSTTSTVVSGENTTWNDDKGTSGEVRVVSTEETPEAVSIPVHKEKVSEVPPLDFIGETYVATSNSNVRGGPDTTYQKVAYLKKDSQINVVGKVKDSDWYFVSEGGIGIGFVFGKLIEPSASSIVGDVPEPENSEEVFEQKVADSRLCRVVEQTVKLADGTVKTEQLKACKGANGWEVQSAEVS